MFIENISKKMTVFMLLFFILELVFFFSLENLYASICLLLGWLMVRYSLFNSQIFRLYPVSFLMILGMSVFFFLLPIPLTLIELKPITYNLKIPFITFSHHFIFLATIIFTHRIYQVLTLNRGANIFRQVLLKTNYYKIPSKKDIYLLSIIALLSTFYIFFVYGQWQRDSSERTPILYIANFITEYMWLPLILLFPKLLRGKVQSEINSKDKIIVICYSVILFVITIASNNRSIMFKGVMSFVLLYFVGLLCGIYSFDQLWRSKKIVIPFILIIFFSGPLIDLGYAMVIVRENRTQTGAADLLEKTLTVYNDGNSIDQVRNIQNSIINNKISINQWDERYLSNIIMNRFVNLKISDNCLYYAYKIGWSNSNMKQVFKNQIISMLPNFLIGALDIDSNIKKQATEGSIGDMLYSIASNDSSVVGSAVISSMPGIGMSIFGYSYLLIIIPIFLIIFMMFDSFVLIGKQPVFTLFFFTMLVAIINYFNDRHVFVFEFRYILRTYFESTLSYILIIKTVRFINTNIISQK